MEKKLQPLRLNLLPFLIHPYLLILSILSSTLSSKSNWFQSISCHNLQESRVNLILYHWLSSSSSRGGIRRDRISSFYSSRSINWSLWWSNRSRSSIHIHYYIIVYTQKLEEECTETWEYRSYFDGAAKKCVKFWFGGCEVKSRNLFLDAEVIDIANYSYCPWFRHAEQCVITRWMIHQL